MPSSRRDFLQTSASAAAALTLGPIARELGAELPSTTASGGVDEKTVRARPVHLSKVRVTGGPLKTAQDVTAKYLLALDPDRMMAFYRVRAGLAQKGAALRRLGRWRPKSHRPHRRPSSVGGEPHVSGDGRRALQGARRLPRARAEGSAGQERRRLSRARSRADATRGPRCRRATSAPAAST